MADTRAQELLRIGSSAFTEAGGWMSLAQDICEQIYPLRADYTANFTLGTDFATGVMDGFTINARETIGNSIDSMLRQGDWFSVSTGDERRDKKAGNALALSRATDIMRKIVRDPRANYQNATKEADHDWVSVGNPVLSWEETPDGQNLITHAWHPKLCAWLVNEMNKVDTVFRRMDMTARDIAKRMKSGRWKGTLHKDVENCAEHEPGKKFPIMHVMLPTEDVYGWNAKDMRRIRHKFVSIYIDETHTEVLNDRGTPVFLYTVPRYRTVSGFSRGFSPLAINSLPDSRMLQSLARIILEQGEKAVDPPMVGDQNVFRNDINLYAGGFTSVDLGEKQRIEDAMQVVNTSEGIATGMQLKQDVRAMIAESWLLNKIFLPNVREMRELEVATRIEEFRRSALPFYAPIDSEFNGPHLSTLFELAVHTKRIPAEIFEGTDLGGSDVEWEFFSPLKEADGQKVVAAFNQSVAIIAAASDAEPGLAKQFNIAEAAIDAVRGAGAKPEWIKPEGERQKVKQSEEEVQNIQRTAAMLDQGAAAAQNVSAAKMSAEQAGLV